MLRKITLMVLVTVLGLALASVAVAQDEPVASGLNNPRHIVFDADGTLYVVEGGNAGDIESEGANGPLQAGLSGQITAVSPDGEQSVLIPDLVSVNVNRGQIWGPMSIYVTDSSYWLVLGFGPTAPLADAAEGSLSAISESVVEVDRESLDVLQVIDLGAFEEENNPDQTPDLASNPADIAVGEDGTLYIADASANALLSWTPDAGLSVFVAWPTPEDQPSAVPTSVAVGPDGSVYVSFLGGFPFAPESSRIEVYNAAGELQQTYEGLTLVTDLLVTADGNVYAVELAGGFGDTGFIPDSGRVVHVTMDGVEAIAEGLNFPYGMAQDADGNFYVTVNSTFAEPDSGMVIALPSMM